MFSALTTCGFPGVLTNLLDNAVKYSPDGGPIEVELVSSDGGAVVRVRDHGPGVPEEKRAALFEPFYQVAENGSGLGLGLYLSRQIVEAHGGRLAAEFPEDGGACFVIALGKDAVYPAEQRISEPVQADLPGRA